MLSSGTIRSRSLVSLLSLSTVVAIVGLPTIAARSQSITPPPEGTTPQPLPEVDDLRPLAQDGSVLSLRGGQRLMSEASSAAAAENYDMAVQKLQEARQVFNQLSNFYQELAASFSGIDNRIADVQRRQALEAAQLRDQSTYQLALVHRAQNKPELSVPLLIQIVRSQQPTRELGQQAYRQLFELGFVDSPYPRQSDDSTSNAPAPNRAN